VKSPTLMSLILSPNRIECDGRRDFLARSQGWNAWRETRMRNSPEVVSNAGDGAGMDGCDRHTAVGDGDNRGCAGKLPPIKEPQTCHFYLLNQVNFENHGGA